MKKTSPPQDPIQRIYVYTVFWPESMEAHSLRDEFSIDVGDRVSLEEL